MEQSTIDEGKTIAIISYLTLIGLLIAFIMNNDKKNEFAKFHIGQALRALIAAILISIVGTVLALFTGISFLSIVGYAGWIFVILGLINAAGGKMEKLPVIGSIGG